jgi:mannose-6-phosphate isomerase
MTKLPVLSTIPGVRSFFSCQTLAHRPMLYPLTFEPIFQPYVWGGKRLATHLNKPIAPLETCAESWEIVDHRDANSRVDRGSLAGTTLHTLVTEQGEALLGRHFPQTQFPLLFKFLDAATTLSVQVHPNDAQAAKLDPPDLGKTEAWVVLAAEPGSKIYAGLQSGIDRQRFEQGMAEGRYDEMLHHFEPRPGDCVFIEAGTLHALGAGVMIAEIQQASNTTFRVYDWDRRDAEGKSRPLHVEQALATIDFARGPVSPVVPTPGETPGIEHLVKCDKFCLDRRTLDESQSVGGDNRFHLLAVIEGAAALSWPRGEIELPLGRTCLVPAQLEGVQLAAKGQAVLLDMYLP